MQQKLYFCFVFDHLIVWKSGWLFGETCFNWNLKWSDWYRGRGAFSQLLHTALRTLQWARYLDQNAKIRPHSNASENITKSNQQRRWNSNISSIINGRGLFFIMSKRFQCHLKTVRHKKKHMNKHSIRVRKYLTRYPQLLAMYFHDYLK